MMLKWSLSIVLVSLLPRNIHLSSTSDTHIDQRLILNINRNLIKSLKLDIRNISYRWFGVVTSKKKKKRKMIVLLPFDIKETF